MLSDLLEAPPHLKAVWKYATGMFGALSVMMVGIQEMQTSSVDSWDFPGQVLQLASMAMLTMTL